MKKIFLLLLIVVLSSNADAQCGPYINYATCSDSLGLIYYSQLDCGRNTQVIWSTGDTAFSVQVPPGNYLANFYVNNIYSFTDNITMFHDTWDLNISFVMVGDLYFSVSLPFCNSSIFTSPSCTPVAHSVTVIVWEDGIPVDTLYNMDCSYSGIDWIYALPGHCYDLSIYDPSCNCYQATWMYTPPRTYCYPLLTGTQHYLLPNINTNNIRYKIINPLGQIIEQGKFSGEIILRNENISRSFNPGIYFVIYSDADDNRQVLTDKVMVSPR